MSDADQDFIRAALPAFISESQEQIAGIEQLLLQLEDAPQDRELLDALFRCAHTVKGSAGIFGLERLVGFTHYVETLLDRLRAGTCALSPALGTLLLRANDEIRRLVDEAGAGSDAGVRDEHRLLIVQLEAACADAPAAAPASTLVPPPDAGATARWRLSTTFGADTFRNGMDPLATLNYLARQGRIVDMACDAGAVPDLESLDPEACHLAFGFGFETGATREQIEAAFSFVKDDLVLGIEPPASAEAVAMPAAAEAPPAAQGDDRRFIRVQADRLDAVINLLGELVTAEAGACVLARQVRQGALVEAHAQIGRLIEEIRDGTLQLRMVAIGETFARFRRVVRDTAAELGKDVAFEVEGGETELDKSVVERIADPLMHLVRNALDHGLETAAERIAAAKPARGRLTLSARHQSGNILISIADDGRGIDRERVLQRAWERGLVEPGVRPSDDDIHRLIFEPGFSTAEKITNLSGRGVGMDVVRRNIEALRGSIALESTPGAGTRIEIRLPLTLAIIDGFLVGIGSSKFIVPLDSVLEVIETGEVAAALDAHGRSLVSLRGQTLPVVDLRRLYGLEGTAPDRVSVLVVRAGSARFGVMVDQLFGQHQTVIKPLGRMLRSLRGISGSSILGSGEVALIVDVNSLFQLAVQPQRRHDPHKAPAIAGRPDPTRRLARP